MSNLLDTVAVSRSVTDAPGCPRFDRGSACRNLTQQASAGAMRPSSRTARADGRLHPRTSPGPAYQVPRRTTRAGVVRSLAMSPIFRSVRIVALAAVSGVATGFFHPAANAGLPNLVEDDDLTNANSLLQTAETLAMMAGPVLAGLMLTVWPPSVPYGVNAITFLVSAALVARIPDARLRSEESVTQGHWRDVSDGIRLVLTSRPLRTVLVVWNVVVVGSAAVNVAEVVFAKKDLDAGNVGFGVLVAASGIGLALGSYLAAPALGKVGLRRHYVGSIALMGVGWGAAALTGSIWLAVPFVIGGAAGNGAAGVCNRLLVQRGAPDQYRGRALATIMSSNYAVVGLAMAAAGVLTDSTATVPRARYQTASEASSRVRRRALPPAYPMPSERVAKSARVVPTVVVATMVAQ